MKGGRILGGLVRCGGVRFGRKGERGSEDLTGRGRNDCCRERRTKHPSFFQVSPDLTGMEKEKEKVYTSERKTLYKGHFVLHYAMYVGGEKTGATEKQGKRT